MGLGRGVLCGLTGGALATLLTGSSVDSWIWGSEGAKVIEATEKLIDDSAKGDTSDLICADSTANFGDPPDWSSLSAGEPETFTGKFGKTKQRLIRSGASTWRIYQRAQQWVLPSRAMSSSVD